MPRDQFYRLWKEKVNTDCISYHNLNIYTFLKKGKNFSYLKLKGTSCVEDYYCIYFILLSLENWEVTGLIAATHNLGLYVHNFEMISTYVHRSYLVFGRRDKNAIFNEKILTNFPLN